MKSYPFSRFKSMTIAVDASLITHQTVIAMRSTGKDLKNSRGELTSHLHGLFYKILIFAQNQMVPIFVFDGKAPKIKNKTITKRRQQKEEAEKILEQLTDSEDEEYIKNFKQTFRPSKENMKEAQIMLDLMGIPYIVAPEEADVVCSWLTSRSNSNGKKYAKGVCSDDSDMLAFGASYLFKDMLKFMSKNKPVTVINLKRTLEGLKLSYEQFTDLCVLLGCDYCETIKNIGPKSAYKLLTKYGSLEDVVKVLRESKPDSVDAESIGCMTEARNYFRNALAQLDNSKDFTITDNQLYLRQYQYEELMDFMCVKHGFDAEKIQKGVDRLKQYYQIMKVDRPNMSKVHKIMNREQLDYNLKLANGNFDFLPSDDEVENERRPSKKNSAVSLVRKP